MFYYIYYKCFHKCFNYDNEELCENLLNKKETLTLEEYIDNKKEIYKNTMNTHYYHKLEENI